MKYSLDKVAKELGISKSTVSFILNGHAQERRISPALEKKVRDFCDRVGYVPNINAKRAGSKYAKNIGFLINRNLLTNGHNPFSDQNTAEITGGIVAAATDADFRVTIQFCDETTTEAEILDWLRNREIDGLIYYAYSFDKSWHQKFVEEKRHVVGIGIKPSKNISTVNINNREIMEKLCSTVIEKGRKKIQYYAGFKNCYVSDERLAGVKEALSKKGLELEKIVYADFSEEKAYNITLNCKTEADTIICANDDMAIGVIKALVEKGISVPDEVSVTGADNIKICDYFSPSITSVDNMNALLGACAFHELSGLINGEKPNNIIVQSKIVQRQSCTL